MPRTRSVTLHRLPLVTAKTELDAFDVELADKIGAASHFFDVSGIPAL